MARLQINHLGGWEKQANHQFRDSTSKIEVNCLEAEDKTEDEVEKIQYVLEKNTTNKCFSSKGNASLITSPMAGDII